jgi:glutathione peroxidase
MVNLRICRPRINPLRALAALSVGILLIFDLDNSASAQTVTRPSGHQACPPLLDRKAPRLQDGAPQDLCRFAGQVVLIVNTASYCGYTQQYEGLEALHKRYSGRGFVVLGFPSNDFGQQEPGSAKQIADLCFNTYGVAFPMFAKTVVVGPGVDPLFAELARASGSPPKWNFHKWLVGRDGRNIAAYPSAVAPLDPVLIRDVERSVGR